MLDRKSSSGSEDVEKKKEIQVERRGSKGSVRSRVENIDELPDPDEGKSPEERKKIVCIFSSKITADTHVGHRIGL